MSAKSAAGVHPNGLWIGCIDRYLDQWGIFCPLLWGRYDGAGVVCSSKKIGIILSLGEYNTVASRIRSGGYGSCIYKISDKLFENVEV